MLFSDAIAILKAEVSKTDSSTAILAQIKSSINFSKIEVAKSYPWKQLKRTGELIIIPYYQTGTATVVKNSRSVSTSGATLTASMVGRYFQPPNGGNWYRINSLNVATGTLTLQSTITENSATGTLKIWKRFYRVPSDIRLILPDDNDPNMTIPFEINGYDLDATAYADGTISSVLGSSLFTGAGTLFLDNIFPGDYVTLEANKYWVRIVHSDTEFQAVNLAQNTVTSSPGSPYSIGSETPYLAEFASAPDVNNTLIPYSYLRHLYPMVHDSDTTELSNSFDRCIIDFSKAEFGRTTNSPTWQMDLQVAQLRLDNLKLNKDLVWFPVRQFAPTVKTGNGRGIVPMPSTTMPSGPGF